MVLYIRTAEGRVTEYERQGGELPSELQQALS